MRSAEEITMSEIILETINRKKAIMRELGEVNAELCDPRIREQPDRHDHYSRRLHQLHSELRRIRTILPPKP